MITIYADFNLITEPTFSTVEPEGFDDNGFQYQLVGSITERKAVLTQVANDYWDQYSSELVEEGYTQARYVTHILECYTQYLHS